MFELTEAPPTPEAAQGLDAFLAVGQRFLGYMRDAGLEPHMSVLDIGCGSGRIAAALAGYLAEGATYDGFDVAADRVAWAADHIRLPGFRFRHVRVRNALYSRDTDISAAAFTFPYEGASFDFAIATSLFTHLPADEMKNYLCETSRVLAARGIFFSTWYLLDEFARARAVAGKTEWMQVELPDGTMVADPERPAIAVGFPEHQVRDALEQAGFSLRAIRYGSWSGRDEPADYQDIVVAVKLPPGSSLGGR